MAGARHVLDGTLGGGGHAQALLEADDVRSVIGVDRDPEAIAAAETRLERCARTGRFSAHRGNYAELGAVDAVSEERFDGILLDLGISSHQIDASDRGFTFRQGALLDMRMGPDAATDAASWIATATERELATAFHDYGDEPHASRLGREIVRRRGNRPLVTSDDLVGAIRGGASAPAPDPATSRGCSRRCGLR